MSKYLLLCLGMGLASLALGCLKATPRQSAGVDPVGKEVTFKGVGGLTLQGTFLAPEKAQRCPAMLLLPGSGPSDRDGNQLPQLRIDTLKDIAEALAKKGVATLRFDKRAVSSKYAASFPKGLPALDTFFSFDAFVGDAEAAFKFLKGRPEVDPGKVGVLGHSEGGLIALTMAKDVHPAALVLVSTAGRNLGTVIVEQVGEGYSSQFRTADQNKKYSDLTKHIVQEIVQTHKVPADVPAEFQSLFPAYLSKYLYSVCTLDPANLAAAYKGPVLVVQGDKDIQVSAKRDAPALMAALAKGSAELFLVPDGTHCMKKYVGPADPGFTGPTLPNVLEKIGSWVTKTLSH